MNDLFTDLGLSGDLVLAVTVYGLIVVLGFWLAMILWTFRDMRSRSRDGLAQLGMALLVALLTVPGLLIYLLLRPRETLAEAYERSLEEEALLQEIEEKPKCPGCGLRVQENWQACPSCHTRLKKVCVRCGSLLELSWQLCPYCTAPQGNYASEPQTAARPSRPARMPEDWSSVSSTGYSARGAASRKSETLEFIEGDDA